MKGPGVSKVVRGIGSGGVWSRLGVGQCFRGVLDWGWLWCSCGAAHWGRGLISVFGERSASVGEVFIFAGGLGAGLSF